MAEAELVSLFEKASNAAGKAVSDGAILAAEEMRCQEALKAMGAVEVSTAILLSTQVGKRLRKLTKHQSSKISGSAQQLLEKWKKVVADEAAIKSGTSKEVSPTIKPETPGRTPPATVIKKEVKTEVKIYTSKTSRADTKNAVPSLKVESTNVPSPRVETKNVRAMPQPHPAGKSATPLAPQSHVAGKAATSSTAPSSSANGTANGSGFQPKVGNLTKAGDSTRDRFRELLIEAFKKCCSEVTDEHLAMVKKTDLVRVAVAVESALFSKLGLSKGSEKAKYRSIMFNLKDQNNPDFRRRILIGEIKPEEIANMTADDMASDARKKENESIREKALFECERGLQNVASTDQFRCGKCGQRKTTYFQLQTRSADEPMTTFVQCVNCNARWKFC